MKVWGVVFPLAFGVSFRADLDARRGLMLFLVKDCCAGVPELCAPVIAELAPCS